MGVSYGCALALRVAADRPDDVAGLVLVNPWVRKDAIVAWQRFLVPFQRFLPYITKSVPGVASDIADPNSAELGYERVPVLLVVDMIKTFDELHPILDRVTAPILLVRSVNDHVQGPKNGEMIRERDPLPDRGPRARALVPRGDHRLRRGDDLRGFGGLHRGPRLTDRLACPRACERPHPHRVGPFRVRWLRSRRSPDGDASAPPCGPTGTRLTASVGASSIGW